MSTTSSIIRPIRNNVLRRLDEDVFGPASPAPFTWEPNLVSGMLSDAIFDWTRVSDTPQAKSYVASAPEAMVNGDIAGRTFIQRLVYDNQKSLPMLAPNAYAGTFYTGDTTHPGGVWKLPGGGNVAMTRGIFGQGYNPIRVWGQGGHMACRFRLDSNVQNWGFIILAGVDFSPVNQIIYLVPSSRTLRINFSGQHVDVDISSLDLSLWHTIFLWIKPSETNPLHYTNLELYIDDKDTPFWTLAEYQSDANIGPTRDLGPYNYLGSRDYYVYSQSLCCGFAMSNADRKKFMQWMETNP